MCVCLPRAGLGVTDVLSCGIGAMVRGCSVCALGGSGWIGSLSGAGLGVGVISVLPNPPVSHSV